MGFIKLNTVHNVHTLTLNEIINIVLEDFYKYIMYSYSLFHRMYYHSILIYSTYNVHLMIKAVYSTLNALVTIIQINLFDLSI